MDKLMLTAPQVVEALQACGITHVVWIPDSYLGTWESSLLNSPTIHLIRACREGEAIAIAGGLMLGGAKPLVVIQCTGLFEAGDALRNIVHDLGLPLLLIVGARSDQAHREGRSTDNCPIFTGPILDAWKLTRRDLDPRVATAADLMTTLREFQRAEQAGAIVISE
jgi:sulfopyruvate decarboxylase TPP-binding subunit